MFSKFGNERQKRWSLFVQQNKKIFYLLTKTVTRQGNFEILKKDSTFSFNVCLWI